MNSILYLGLFLHLISTFASCFLAFSLPMGNVLLQLCLTETLHSKISLFQHVGCKTMVLVQCSPGEWWGMHESKLLSRNEILDPGELWSVFQRNKKSTWGKSMMVFMGQGKIRSMSTP